MPNASTTPLWMDVSATKAFAPLAGDATYDVVIVGAGITGLTAALLLKRAGRRVAVVERHRVGEGETGHTSAHLSLLLDERYHSLASDFGQEGAQLAAQASRDAIDFIERFTREQGADASFRRVPAFLYAEDEQEEKELQRELDAARAVGLRATLVDALPFDLPMRRALRVEDQADFHPRRYVLALADQVHGNGSAIFENTRVLQVKDGAPCEVVTGTGKLTARDVVVAANSAINNLFFLQTKLAPYRTYALAGPTVRDIPPGHYYDMKDPYHYTRVYDSPHGRVAIIGGEDHRVGEGDPAQALGRLESFARERMGLTDVVAKWSGQILEPVDGLPYLGRNSTDRHVYISVGYSGTGLTFGTVGGMVTSDLILGRENPYATLFKATRIKPVASAKEFVSENVDFPLHLVLDRFTPPEAKSLDEIAPGEGKLMSVGAKKLAVYRDDGGALSACNATCTHMGCVVHWNGAEKSWDCPCHGGRFDAHGRVLNGPPVKDLAVEKLP